MLKYTCEIYITNWSYSKKSRNCFSYVPETEIRGGILGWTTSSISSELSCSNSLVGSQGRIKLTFLQWEFNCRFMEVYSENDHENHVILLSSSSMWWLVGYWYRVFCYIGIYPLREYNSKPHRDIYIVSGDHSLSSTSILQIYDKEASRFLKLNISNNDSNDSYLFLFESIGSKIWKNQVL